MHKEGVKLSLKTLKAEFQNVPKGYGPVPFWFWNDDLDKNHLLFQIEEMYDKGIEEFIIHARRGLTIKYLSEEWFERVAFTLKEAQKREMCVWIYDENNWPSGYADGKVLAENPDYQVKYLNRTKAGNTIPEGTRIIAEDEEMVYYAGYTKRKTAYSEANYVDMLDKNATETFIRCTHEQYYKRFKEYFGVVIKGFFVDEPGFTSNFDFNIPLRFPGDDRFGITWTHKFPEYFKERKGYDIIPYLKHLWKNEDNLSYKYRVDYCDVLGQMYRENFLGVLQQFCQNHGVKLIGHLHIEDFLPYHVKTAGDMFKGIGMIDLSGVDKIDLNSDKVTEKYGSSVEHFYKKGRTLSETFAVSGWGLDTNEIKKWTNWQYVRGVNMMVPHAFYSSIAGDRVKECPPSLFYQNYYWKYFSQYSNFVKRLGYILTRGVHSCPVAVYYPITSHQELVLPDNLEKSKVRDRELIEVCNGLLDYQIDYDFVNDEGFSVAQIHSGRLVVKDEQYKAVILVGVSNIPKSTLKTLVEFMESGGVIALIGETEIKDTAGENDEEYRRLAQKLLNSKGIIRLYARTAAKRYSYQFDSKKLADLLHRKKVPDFSLIREDPDIKYMKRKLNEGTLYYLINEGKVSKSNRFTIAEIGKIYYLDPQSGEIEPYEEYYIDQKNNVTEVAIYLEKYGEIILLVLPEDAKDIDKFKAKPEKNINKNYNFDKFKSYQCYNLMDGWQVSVAEVFTHEGIETAKEEAEILKEGKLMPIAEWRQWGMTHFSGIIKYCREFEIQKEPGAEYILDLGQVYYCVEVEINGHKAAEMMWDPYKVNITTFLKDGKNTIELYVSNTLGNMLEKKDYPSGIKGPISIIAAR